MKTTIPPIHNLISNQVQELSKTLLSKQEMNEYVEKGRERIDELVRANTVLTNATLDSRYIIEDVYKRLKNVSTNEPVRMS